MKASLFPAEEITVQKSELWRAFLSDLADLKNKSKESRKYFDTTKPLRRRFGHFDTGFKIKLSSVSVVIKFSTGFPNNIFVLENG